MHQPPRVLPRPGCRGRRGPRGRLPRAADRALAAVEDRALAAVGARPGARAAAGGAPRGGPAPQLGLSRDLAQQPAH
eukprot:11843140-Alexandrium_andersonii.AAC.1